MTSAWTPTRRRPSSLFCTNVPLCGIPDAFNLDGEREALGARNGKSLAGDLGRPEMLTGSDVCDIRTGILDATLCGVSALSVSELSHHRTGSREEYRRHPDADDLPHR